VRGIEIWLEVHGRDTQVPTVGAAIMKQTNHPSVGLCWNSNPTDVVNVSVKQSFELLRPWIKSCHINELANPAYPGVNSSSSCAPPSTTAIRSWRPPKARSLNASCASIAPSGASSLAPENAHAIPPPLNLGRAPRRRAPTPGQFFGHPMGADKSTLEWSKVVDYFKQLDAASDRVQVTEFGKSTEGRPLIAAFISAPSTLNRLEHYRQIQKRLADPRRTSPADAAKLIAEGKTIVLITCSIHATEVASSHAAIEFARRMATSTDPAVRAILDNTIVILAPSINPDGLDIVGAWYRKTLGTSYEGTSPPELYQKYVGHDNNRDWYIFSQAETRAIVAQLHNRWHPQIVYDLHQMGMTAARIWVPPFMDPIEPNVDPLIIQQANLLGSTMAADLTDSGRQGVAVNAMYDFWTPARHYQSYHGGIRILTESASVRIATPVTIRPDQLSTSSLGYSARRTWNHTNTWTHITPPGRTWTLRNIGDDQLVAIQSLLTVAASRRERSCATPHEAWPRCSPNIAIRLRCSGFAGHPGAAKKLWKLSN